MNDKPIVEPGFDDDDDYDEAADDAWEEEETRKRYPGLYGETDESQWEPKVSESGFGVDDDDRIVVPPKYQKQLDQARARLFAQQHFVSRNGTN